MQCFTATTESPSIAATSTARAPPRSSTDSPPSANDGAGAAVAPNGAGMLAGADMPGGGRMPGGGAAGCDDIIVGADGGATGGRAGGAGGWNEGGALGGAGENAGGADAGGSI